MLVGLSGHAVSAGDLPDFDSVVCAGVIRDEFFERGADARLDGRGIDSRSFRKCRFLDERINLVEGNGRFGRVNDGFELGSKIHKNRRRSLVVRRWLFAVNRGWQALLTTTD